MFGNKSCEALVVGAGPVGLTAALALAQRGVRVQIIDEGWRGGAHSYALALHPGALALLDDLGLGEPLLRVGRRIDRIDIYRDAEPLHTLRLSDLPGPHPYVLVLRQDVFERLLVDRLAARGVRVQWEHRLAGLEQNADRAEALVQKLAKSSGGYAVAGLELVIERERRLNASYVIGADGHRSAVRRALGIEFEQVGPTESFAVFEFQTDAQALRSLRIVLEDARVNVLWPMPNDYCRWSFQLDAGAAEPEPREKQRLAVQVGDGAYPHLSERDLLELLQSRAPWFDARVGEINWSMAVRFERRLASAAGSGRCWLAGDALHLTGPVGVQSMNVGLREAATLAAAIAGVLRDGAAPTTLEQYAAERRDEWRDLLGQGGGATATDAADPWLAAQAARAPSCLPASGPELTALLEQLGLRLA